MCIGVICSSPYSSISLTWSTRIFLFYYVKELLDFRILEGLTVNYLRGSKMTEARARGLKGVIRSCVMCFCSVCKGIQACNTTFISSNVKMICQHEDCRRQGFQGFMGL
ncbi:hypothetical protein Bca101_036463 [Brassica carinata]